MTHSNPDKQIYMHIFSSLPKTVIIPSFTDSMRINSNSYNILKVNHHSLEMPGFGCVPWSRVPSPAHWGTCTQHSSPPFLPQSLAKTRQSHVPSKYSKPGYNFSVKICFLCIFIYFWYSPFPGSLMAPVVGCICFPSKANGSTFNDLL